jgi:hypothetical protein
VICAFGSWVGDAVPQAEISTAEIVNRIPANNKFLFILDSSSKNNISLIVEHDGEIVKGGLSEN